MSLAPLGTSIDPARKASPAAYRMVFVGGLHRSGTSFLHACIREHPLVSGFRDTGAPEDEGQHLQTVFPPGSAFGGPGRFAFSPAAHLTEGSAEAAPDGAARLWSDWSRFWDLDKPVLVEKSPPNLIRTRFLARVFPQARFIIIVIVRHPLVVALSTQKWANCGLACLLEHWFAAHKLFQADARSLSPDSYRVVRYEDLVRDPYACLDPVFAFLGLPAHHQLPESLDTSLDACYLRQWEARNGSMLSRLQQWWLEKRFEKRARAYGYSLDPAKPYLDCPAPGR